MKAKKIDGLHFGLKVYSDGKKKYAVGTKKQVEAACFKKERVSLWECPVNCILQFAAGRNDSLDPNNNDIWFALYQMTLNLKSDCNEIFFCLIGGDKGFKSFMALQLKETGRAVLIGAKYGMELKSEDIKGLPHGLYAYVVE